MAIVITSAWISLDGTDFSPGHLMKQTGLSFSKVIEKGVTILPIGRHRDLPAPYSCAVLEAIPSSENETIDDQLVSLLGDLHSKIGNQPNEFTIDSISVWLLLKSSGDGQHGFEMRPDALLLMGQLGATLCIDYIP